jgi:type IV pilus assembly protein PilO
MKLKATKGDDVKEGTKFDLQEFMNTLNTLDPQNIGSWPLAAKVLVYIIVFIVVLVLGYVLDLSAMRETYDVGRASSRNLVRRI